MLFYATLMALDSLDSRAGLSSAIIGVSAAVAVLSLPETGKKKVDDTVSVIIA